VGGGVDDLPTTLPTYYHRPENHREPPIGKPGYLLRSEDVERMKEEQQ